MTVPRLARTLAILVGYCTAFIVLDYLSHTYAGRPVASPWYLPAALGFYVVYTFGWRYAAIPLLAELLNWVANAIVPPSATQSLPGWTYVALGVEMTIAYSGAALLLRKLQVRVPFTDLRDAFWYIGVAVFAAPTIASLMGVPSFVYAGIVPVAGYAHESVTFAIGDSMGFLTLVPALALFLTPLVAPELLSQQLKEERRIGAGEVAALVTVVMGVSYLGYRWLELGGSAPLYYFLFLPLVWMAARGGVRFATVGVVAADLSVVLLDIWFRTPVLESLTYQSYIASSALTALILGSVMNQRWRDNAEDLERARVDRVTGLPNPQALDEWLKGYRFHRPVTLLLVSIDNLRWVHDGLHREGVDLFLKSVAERLAGSALKDPTLGYRYMAHASDAEFAVLIAGDDRMIAETAVDRIRQLLARPITVGETEIYAAVSIGIATCADRERANKLVPHASRALEEARVTGMEVVAFHVARENEEPVISLAAQLHRAVASGEFDVVYQPIYRLPEEPIADRRLLGASIDGVEALLRWNHPTRGLLSPFYFIELLESMSLASRVGAIVINKTVDQLAKWEAKGVSLELWLNGFVRQVMDPEFAGSLRATLLQHAIEPRMVNVELLEHEFARDEGSLLDAVARLRQVGVRVAIDDFGTGHSSLARLREVPFDRLKIDRSFVGGLGVDRRAEDVVTTLRSLAHDFDVPALAEGVETEAQLRFLIENNFHYAQGYYLGLPMPPTEIEALLFEAGATRRRR